MIVFFLTTVGCLDGFLVGWLVAWTGFWLSGRMFGWLGCPSFGLLDDLLL